VSAAKALPSRLMLVTDRHLAAVPLDEVVREAIAAGARWIWLRDRDLPAVERHALAQRLMALARPRGVRLTIGGDVALAAEIGADGVQLAAGATIATARARLGPGALIGVSAHGEADVTAAAAGGADYATLSPIFVSVSKPAYGPALGTASLARAAAHGLPLIALGGVTPGRVDECLRAGATSVAVMGEVMRAAARAAGVRDAVRRYAAALDAFVG
jgi:thiamine-phosphate pyrophosphorylase